MGILALPSPSLDGWADRVRRRAHRGATVLYDRMEDARLGIDTYAPTPTQLPHPDLVSAPYEPMDYRALRILGRRLDLKPDDVLYDLGCGMGRVTCYFSRWSIARSVGVEFDPRLAGIARRNSERVRGRQAPIDIQTADAAHHGYADGTVFFLYNPFGAEVLRKVLARIEQDRAGQPVRIAYAYPLHAAVLDATPWLRRSQEAFKVPHLAYVDPVQMWASA